MLSRWFWLALGAGAYLAFTLTSFPATTAWAWFGREPVRLAGIEGTIWTGRAALGSVAQLAVSDIRWHVHPLPLLLGRLTADLEVKLTDGFVTGRVAATPSSVELTQLKVSTSLPVLQAVLPVRGMQGLANADFSRLRLERGWPTVAIGRVRLAEIEVAPLVPTGGQQLVPLGNYEVTFDDDMPEDGITGTFRDTGGPLEVTGSVVVEENRAYKLDSLIKPRADASSALVQGLSIMTPEPDAQGRRRLTLTGSL